MATKAVKFTPKAARQILEASRRTLRSSRDLRGRRRVTPSAPFGFEYGKLKAAWVPGKDEVTLTPCDPEGGVASPPPDDITARINVDGTPPLFFPAAVGTVLAYVTLGNMPPTPDQGTVPTGDTYQLLPSATWAVGTADGMVPQMTTGATRVTWDYIKVTA